MYICSFPYNPQQFSHLWLVKFHHVLNKSVNSCNEVHLNYVKCIIVYTQITLALYRLD